MKNEVLHHVGGLIKTNALLYLEIRNQMCGKAYFDLLVRHWQILKAAHGDDENVENKERNNQRLRSYH